MVKAKVVILKLIEQVGVFLINVIFMKVINNLS